MTGLGEGVIGGEEPTGRGFIGGGNQHPDTLDLHLRVLSCDIICRHRCAHAVTRAIEARGIPLAAVPAPANRRDDGLLAATLDAVGLLGPLPERPTMHLDAGYDWQPCRLVLNERGMAGEIATRGRPAPVQASRRWPVERTHAWGNQYGKLRWCTERRRIVVEFWLALAGAVIVCGRLVCCAWTSYRWDSRPRRRP